mmetsp:Transcript_52753/g.122773  ORF Transcript_52753/g.122773 Transcript_52753/m.122773 type:complete len:453 (-) Transcript_52753:161-1519(-)
MRPDADEVCNIAFPRRHRGGPALRPNVLHRIPLTSLSVLSAPDQAITAFSQDREAHGHWQPTGVDGLQVRHCQLRLWWCLLQAWDNGGHAGNGSARVQDERAGKTLSCLGDARQPAQLPQLSACIYLGEEDSAQGPATAAGYVRGQARRHERNVTGALHYGQFHLRPLVLHTWQHWRLPRSWCHDAVQLRGSQLDGLPHLVRASDVSRRLAAAVALVDPVGLRVRKQARCVRVSGPRGHVKRGLQQSVLEGLKVVLPARPGSSCLNKHLHHLDVTSLRSYVQGSPASTHREVQQVAQGPAISKHPHINPRPLLNEPFADLCVALGSSKRQGSVPVNVIDIDVEANCCAVRQLADGCSNCGNAAPLASGEDIYGAVIVLLPGCECHPPEEDPIQNSCHQCRHVHHPMHLPVCDQLLPVIVSVKESEDWQQQQLNRMLRGEAHSYPSGSSSLDR